jgi:D-alanyl-D-alanine carboxypeptidase
MSDISHTVAAIDALLQAAYQPDEPGAAVIAVKDGRPVFRKGYGLANVELGVPIAPDMVFRLASITKQFTAVAILMLMEQGQLALQDSITRFMPDYPMHDHRITIEHLLTHTSGIRSYTDMPEWPPLWRKDFSVQELIDFFKEQPMQFAPGQRWAYNNSGYHLLGAIIEQLSGLSYEQFIQQHIFEPLGMRQSYYDSPTRIISKRASG